MKFIDYVVHSGYLTNRKPKTPQQKVAEYAIARIKDYAEDCSEDEDKFFKDIMLGNNELESLEHLYCNLKEVVNLEEMTFLNSAFILLNTELNENIISNMEKACVEYYDTMLSSDIEYLIIDSTWDDLIKHITTI